MSFEYEWKEMPREVGKTDQQWGDRGVYYAVRQRVVRNKDFFDRVFKLQPPFMALFGEAAENTFLLLHRARREIEVASEMLTWRVRNPIGPQPNQDQAFWEQCRRDIWDHGDVEPEKDKVGKKLKQFRSEIEGMCKPVIDRGFAKQSKTIPE